MIRRTHTMLDRSFSKSREEPGSSPQLPPRVTETPPSMRAHGTIPSLPPRVPESRPPEPIPSLPPRPVESSPLLPSRSFERFEPPEPAAPQLPGRCVYVCVCVCVCPAASQLPGRCVCVHTLSHNDYAMAIVICCFCFMVLFCLIKYISLEN